MSTDKELTPIERVADFLSQLPEEIGVNLIMEDAHKILIQIIKEYGQQEEARGYERGLKEANEWVSIYSSLPPNRTGVLIYLAGWPQGSINMGYYQDKRFWLHGEPVDHITHWKPLPAPPQQGKGTEI